MRADLLALMLAELSLVSEPKPERKFLFDRGWVPLGRDALTGLEGWGKVINHKAVTISEAEALELEGWER